MADLRKKLVELKRALRKSVVWGYDDVTDTKYIEYEETAKKLIANGVTTQRWIPVVGRLPEESVRVLVYMEPDAHRYTDIDTDRLRRGRFVRWGDDVTHWMPLPEPPEEKL